MRRSCFLILFLLTISPMALAEKPDKVALEWWALTAFRIRHQTAKEYTDISFRGSPGVLLYTEDNTSVRAGYQLGFRIAPYPNLAAGLTLRSGMYGSAMEMVQRFNNREGFLPAVQELYIAWKFPAGHLELGKIPQEGTPLWDLYAATLQTDFRADDPRDGVFIDRMASLNGARLALNIDPLTIKGIYHADDVDGFKRINNDASVRQVRRPDRYVWLGEADLHLFSLIPSHYTELFSLRSLTLTGDYGLPYRAAVMTDPDSSYADEKLWGVNLNVSTDLLSVKGGYAYNWRDSVYTNRFWDGMVTLNLGNITTRYLSPFVGAIYPRLSQLQGVVRYQYGNQRHEFGIYKGHTIKRFAWHYYLNLPVGDLLLQPRVIVFENVIEGFRQRKQWRYEVTTYLTF